MPHPACQEAGGQVLTLPGELGGRHAQQGLGGDRRSRFGPRC